MNTRQRRRRFHRQTQPGAKPGVIAVSPDAPAPCITVTSYNAEHLEQLTTTTLDEIRRMRESPGVLWIDVEGLGDAESIRHIGKLFGLHSLALEDVANVHQQVKVEDYGEHLYVVCRLADDTKQGRTGQVSLFIGQDFVITFQERSGAWLAPLRQRLQDPRSQLRSRGADFLGYAILDAVIDGYFPLLEHCGEQLDDLEDEITDEPPRSVMHRIHDIRSELRSLRRVTWSHRDTVARLLHDPNPVIVDETRIYLRDCYDHTIQLIDVLEIFHETCTDLRDVYLSTVSNRLNEIMMVLTIIATIFIPLGFIASLYGMNFNTAVSPWNMPELDWFYGYPFALGFMLAVACLLLAFFYTRGWFRRSGK